MKLWLTTTEAATVHRCFDTGLFVGVLTNPTTLAATGRAPFDVIAELCAATSAPVFFQLKDGSVETMKRQADLLLNRRIENAGIKVALTPAGCAVLQWLREQRVPHRLATAVPHSAALLLATAVDVPWVTPSGSVLEKAGGPSKGVLLAEMQLLLAKQNAPTRLIPSFASPAEMTTLALAGIQHGFIWDRDVDRFLDHELVREVVASFDSAWDRIESLAC